MRKAALKGERERTVVKAKRCRSERCLELGRHAPRSNWRSLVSLFNLYTIKCIKNTFSLTACEPNGFGPSDIEACHKATRTGGVTVWGPLPGTAGQAAHRIRSDRKFNAATQKARATSTDTGVPTQPDKKQGYSQGCRQMQSCRHRYFSPTLCEKIQRGDLDGVGEVK